MASDTLRNVGALWLATGLAVIGCDDGSQSDPVVISPDGTVDASFRPDSLPPAIDAAPPLVDGALAQDARVSDLGSDSGPAPDGGQDAEIVRPACSNFVDDDGDGLTDYPADRGCTGLDDVDEQDPAQAECGDGADNDGDGLTDTDDPGCAAADDPSEASVCGADVPMRDITGLSQVEGVTSGPSRLQACRGNDAPEAVFVYTLREAVDRLHFDTIGTAFDTLLAARLVCDDDANDLACSDDLPDGRKQSAVDIDGPSPGDYYVVIDGFLDAQGPFTLNIRAELDDGRPCDQEGSAAVCGTASACVDGICAPAQCSDLQDNDGDGLTDFPNDPGCDFTADNDETTPELLPECADGIDNDANGVQDFPDDPNCSSAADAVEARSPQCRDGIDNDRDGLVDLADPGCLNDPDRDGEFNTEACRNALDDDEDGLIDFPEDPGCTDPRDVDERDPEAAPQCSDGIDNDEDGLTDYPADEGSCLFAADDTEDDPCARQAPREITGLALIRGNTANAPNDFRLSCENGTAPDALLSWRVADDRPLLDLRINMANSDFNTVLARVEGCGGAELQCDDNSGPFGAAVLRTGPLEAGTEAVFVLSGGFSEAFGIWRGRVKAWLAEGANCTGSGPGSPFVCGDGLACADVDGAQICAVSQCADGIDNDDDGLTDYPFEPGCESASDNDETDPDVLAACSNAIDDDEDGLVDFGQDPRCDSAADDFEGPDCSDRLDNDGDGSRDFDRDGDGFGDFDRDPGCACAEDPSESVDPQCGDGCDNDRDGLVDLEDPGCMGDPSRNNEFNVPFCQDGIDNDGDGLTDYPFDPGCSMAQDQDETTPDPLPECADGIDNDGDGLLDFASAAGADDGCQSAGDDDERGPCDVAQRPLPEGGVAEGSTLVETGEHVGTCRTGSAPEATFVVDLPYPATVTLSLAGSTFDTVLYVRSDCRAQTVCRPEPEAVVDAGVAVDASLLDASLLDAGAADAGDADLADAGAADAGDASLLDASLLDASLLDASLLDAGDANLLDAGGVQCLPESTELSCNDDFNGLQSELVLDWQGELFIFVDGFGNAAGDYVLTVTGTYADGAQCGPILLPFISCAVGSACLPDAQNLFPTCQVQ